MHINDTFCIIRFTFMLQGNVVMNTVCLCKDLIIVFMKYHFHHLHGRD